MPITVPTISGATREELVAYVKQLLAENELKCVHVNELEAEVECLKQKLDEKSSAVAALTEQNKTLSEMLVADEEGKRMLLRQIEDTSMGGDLRLSGPNVVGGDINDSGTSIATGATCDGRAVLRFRSDEIAELQQRVRELEEVNSFCAAIVANHDEKKMRTGEELFSAEIENRECVDVERLRERIRSLECERHNLRHMLHHNERDKKALSKEVRCLRSEVGRLETDLTAVERWKVDEPVARCPSPVGSGAQVSEISPVQRRDVVASRTFAQYVAPIRYRGDVGKRIPKHFKKGVYANAMNDQYQLPRSQSQSRSLLQFDSLPEIHLSNPTKQEQMLLERVELYRKRVEEMSAHEVDRQRSFDEIEQARAELFTEMNFKLDEQRREIQRLSREIATITGSCNAVGAPVKKPCKVEEVQAYADVEPFRESYPVPTERTLGVDSGSNDATKGATVSVEQVSAEEAKYSGTWERNFLVPVEAACFHPSGDEKAWPSMSMAEKCERVDIFYKECEDFVAILTWSRATFMFLAMEYVGQAAAVKTELANHQSLLADVQTSVLRLERQRADLLEELATLREAPTSRSLVETGSDDDPNILLSTSKMNQRTPAEAAFLIKPWGALQCICEAYGEVVGGQIALLRALTAEQSVGHDHGERAATYKDSVSPPQQNSHVQKRAEGDVGEAADMATVGEEFLLRLRGGDWITVPIDCKDFEITTTVNEQHVRERDNVDPCCARVEALEEAGTAAPPVHDQAEHVQNVDSFHSTEKNGSGTSGSEGKGLAGAASVEPPLENAGSSRESDNIPAGQMVSPTIPTQQLHGVSPSTTPGSNTVALGRNGEMGAEASSAAQSENVLENLFGDTNASTPASRRSTQTINLGTFTAEFDPFA